MTVCYAHGNEESSSTNAKPGRPLRDLWLHYAELRNRQLRLRGAWIQTAWRECFNKQVADASGLTGFEDAKFEPVGLTDSTGEIHEFHFRTHLFVAGVSIDAFELRDGHPSGYQFQIIADPEEDLLAVLGRLIEKIRRALSTKHLTESEHGTQIADHRVVRGRIEWDDTHDDRVPLLVIDGREIGWDEFGRMLMSFEGCQFKLNIVDKSEQL